jgi:hypothetical protein
MLVAQISALTKAREDRKKQEEEVKGITFIPFLVSFIICLCNIGFTTYLNYYL